MQMQGHTILITGGGSGIGRALAVAFQTAGNRVIIAGRRKALLDETVAAHPGMQAVALDIEDAADIARCARALIANFPALDIVVHNAGIMRNENVRHGDVADAEATIATNLLGPIRLTAALLPHLLAQPQAAIVTVSSGLAHVPLAMTPTYCATKAAIHSYTQSLRYQLKDTAVRVVELVPPYVQTGLMGDRQASDPNAMPLDAYIAETMRLLSEAPDADEVLVERVLPLRQAERNGAYDAFYRTFNDAMFAARRGEWNDAEPPHD